MEYAKEQADKCYLPPGEFRRRMIEALEEAGFAEVQMQPGQHDLNWELSMHHGTNPPYVSAQAIEVQIRRIVRPIGFTIRQGGIVSRLDGNERFSAAFILFPAARP